MKIIINDNDINWAENILLPPGEHFDDERKAVIKCLESKDILACPGSGKTTTLLAKLLILSRQMPFENNRGICVLTHTNVAIDKIKTQASFASYKLFNYPNHFGTIQSFVDKYLTLPAYILRYKKRPKYIDNEIYDSIIKKNYQTLHAAKKWLDRKLEGGEDYLKKLRFNKDDFSISKKIEEQPFVNINTGTYQEINRLKLNILSWGYLCFDDAYSLAFEYLREHPGIRDLISKRFLYVFIDEMQDTSTIQHELLRKIFNDNVTIQKIGDLNQSIFDYDGETECGWAIIEDRKMYITGSKRFLNSIANKVENLCVHRQPITGNNRENEITPVIIVYQDNTINELLNKFGEIIISNNLHLHKNAIFKAVGWCGKKHISKITIPSYWGGYIKQRQVKKSDFENLNSYLVPQPDSVIFAKGTNFYLTRLVAVFVKCLRIGKIADNGRIFTDKRLLKHILENEPDFYKDFRIKLANWCLQIQKKEDISEEVKNFILNDFNNLFNFQINNELVQFINSVNMEVDNFKVMQNNNIYKFNSQEIKFDIEVSTIHGVKGETHTSTCYLETFYHEYDIKRIINYIKGEYTIPTQKRIIQNLKMAFVGMSRPSYLLCVAIHQNSINGHEEDLIRNGWEINNDLCV